MFMGLLVDKSLVGSDSHLASGCISCHKGDDKAQAKDDAHKGIVKNPSDDPRVCGECHQDISKNYTSSLHYTTEGLRTGIQGRLSAAEKKSFDEKVFEQSCRTCHASCGDCHVKGPRVSGISIGLIRGHKFVRKDEGKTCAMCHGGRVYPEFTGEYGGYPDVHYQNGMVCVDCHKVEELHGDSPPRPVSMRDVKQKPSCTSCHPTGQEKNEKARSAHIAHKDRLSCSACHASAPYRNCYGCHLGKGGTSKPGFFLGKSPRDWKTVVTLRHVPTARDTFLSAGIKMESYDALPNYWESVPHNTRKRTERTRSCSACHEQKKDFLSHRILVKEGSKSNEGVLYTPKPIKK
jgi:hypothetical protein